MAIDQSESRIQACHVRIGFLRCFQHCTGHIMAGSFMGRGNQYIQLVKVLYCKLLTISKKLPSFQHRVQGLNCRRQRWETSVIPLHSTNTVKTTNLSLYFCTGSITTILNAKEVKHQRVAIC